MMDVPQRMRFPDDFLWGVATSSYQIEGADAADGRSPSIWDEFARRDGAIRDGSSGAVACDHYHRWRDDIALMKQLGVKAYRFSIAWPRVLPDGAGRVNEDGLAFYDRLIDTLLDQEIEPFVTLYHWDMPQAQHALTPWTDRGVVSAFARYVDIVTRAFGDRVRYWMTINEPWVIAYMGYGSGEHAPGEKSWPGFLRAAHHVLLAHGEAVPILRANGSASTRVGIVLNLSYASPASDSEADRAAAWRWDGFYNRWFLDALFKGSYPADMRDLYGPLPFAIEPDDMDTIRAPLDFLGVNYYTRSVMRAARPENAVGSPVASVLGLEQVFPDTEYTAMRWEVYPDGLERLLTRVHRDYAPPALYVTENGAAYEDVVAGDIVDDPERLSFLERHFAAAHRAIEAGVPLRGYFVWSLLDNFEWAYGYSHRFGIVYVDYETQRRILKRSALWYADVIRDNGIALRAPVPG